MPYSYNIAKIHAQFRSGELTPRELVEQCLARIDGREADVQAWVSVDREGALHLADEQLRLLSSLTARPTVIRPIVEAAVTTTNTVTIAARQIQISCLTDMGDVVVRLTTSASSFASL